MKSNLQTLIVLLNIVFVICKVSPLDFYWFSRQDNHAQPLSLDTSREEQPTDSTKAPTFEENAEEISAVQHVPDNSGETTTEDPGKNNETTTANTIETTPKDGVKYCPKGQSSFTKHDLIAIINYYSDGQFNILPNISDAYHDTAIQARDELLQEFNEFKRRFEDRPNHLIHVLEDMADTRQIKIVPLVKIAAETLQEFPAVEDDFNRLNKKTLKMLDNLEKYKTICELNNCNPQLLRSSFPLGSNGQTVVSEDEENNLCSTIENVHTTISERLLSFEQEEIERLKKYVTDNEEVLEKAIDILKVRLREAAVSDFGITMYEILNLYDDHFHFMNSLIDFNRNSPTNTLKKRNMNIEFKLLDLDSNIQRYRKYCLNCGQVQRRRRLATLKMDEENTENVSDNNETNILDQLINDKIVEIGKIVQAHVDDIFKVLNDTVNDNELVEKTVALLKPIQESVSNRTVVEKKALDSLMKSVSKEKREHANDVKLNAAALIDSINKALVFFPKKNTM